MSIETASSSTDSGNPLLPLAGLGRHLLAVGETAWIGCMDPATASSISATTDAILGGDWGRYLFVDDEEPEPVCLCGCRKFHRTGSHEQGDGTRRIYAVCLRCQRQWIIVDERTETKFGKQG